MVEVAPSQRPALACELLLGPERRPGIVYTPTRKQAESLAAELSVHFPTAAYHAGLDADRRQRAQERFFAGKVEVMVATIAFGMGIDKPNIRTVIHTALPGSIEAYYQEIGRAGRDGKPSRAVLMHSYADRYTHDFFFERDYPDVAVLDAMFARLRSEPIVKAALLEQMPMDSDLFDKALEKLWIHGGAVLDYAENVSAGQGQWRESYIAHGEQKRAQIEHMIRFASANQCRMSSLVRHFGDLADGQTACGICDFCAPAVGAGLILRRLRRGPKPHYADYAWFTAHPETIHPDAAKSSSRIGPASRIGLPHASVYRRPPTGQKVLGHPGECTGPARGRWPNGRKAGLSLPIALATLSGQRELPTSGQLPGCRPTAQ